MNVRCSMKQKKNESYTFIRFRFTLSLRVAGLSLRDGVRNSAIREGLRVEPQLLHIERRQKRWFGHLKRMTPG